MSNHVFWFFCYPLLQPAPRELPLQCLIKRNKKNGIFYLSLALTPCKSLLVHLPAGYIFCDNNPGFLFV